MQYVIGVGIGFDTNGKAIPVATALAALHTIATHAAEIFGGCFIQRGYGSWKDGSNIIVEEGASIIIDVPKPCERRLNAFAGFICDLLNQSAVMVTQLESEQYLISKRVRKVA